MAARSEQTKNRIYQAALEEFAQYGIAGARVDRIAKAAQANKQAIYLYFGDKEKLFALVLGRVLEELAEAVAPPSGSDGVAAYIERLFAYHQEHPAVLRLLLWEALEFSTAEVPDEESRTAHYQEKAGAIGGIGDAGTAGPLGPQALLLVFTGLVGWPLAVPQVTRMIMGDDAGAMGRTRAAIVAAAQTIADARQQGADGE
ncbi:MULTISPECIES: TetR/AcrR family transcriptional regulator [unclassified Streptomyces]|uniref:TetR/AcrR family transcriptional regulator n=1 Tax=unclassified Streptomyces TaxID=2593676 RepID=UPI000DAC626C|nr:MULTISPECIES: TetR family transcriptional regulator [unclassified Streptomyces]PZT74777.1 TetR/AcrR family transcriptional regulator [Streptomyces sp. AC1-42T]PZT82237.1 TetR/AcrR family transcriptional regulator [Streptomyces sp. AC1-42W]WUC93389.1 TetR family transcriptional regulator [Streptomyces sp. NBC_00525]